MKGEFSQLEKKYHKAKKLIKDYQTRCVKLSCHLTSVHEITYKNTSPKSFKIITILFHKRIVQMSVVNLSKY